MPLYQYEIIATGESYEKFCSYEDREADLPEGHKLCVCAPHLRVSDHSKRVAGFDKFHDKVIAPRLKQAGTPESKLRFGNTAGI